MTACAKALARVAPRAELSRFTRTAKLAHKQDGPNTHFEPTGRVNFHKSCLLTLHPTGVRANRRQQAALCTCFAHARLVHRARQLQHNKGRHKRHTTTPRALSRAPKPTREKKRPATKKTKTWRREVARKQERERTPPHGCLRPKTSWTASSVSCPRSGQGPAAAAAPPAPQPQRRPNAHRQRCRRYTECHCGCVCAHNLANYPHRVAPVYVIPWVTGNCGCVCVWCAVASHALRTYASVQLRAVLARVPCEERVHARLLVAMTHTCAGFDSINGYHLLLAVVVHSHNGDVSVFVIGARCTCRLRSTRGFSASYMLPPVE